VSSFGVSEKPETAFLCEWTDIFGKSRMALSLQRRDVESLRTVDPDARVSEGRVEWNDQRP
jgi:hypothetical protein